MMIYDHENTVQMLSDLIFETIVAFPITVDFVIEIFFGSQQQHKTRDVLAMQQIQW